jgi:hypothetical protein
MTTYNSIPLAIVYRHIRLDKNEPFYIGVGSSLYRKDSRNILWYNLRIENIFTREHRKKVFYKKMRKISYFCRAKRLLRSTDYPISLNEHRRNRSVDRKLPLSQSLSSIRLIPKTEQCPVCLRRGVRSDTGKQRINP